jgi:hypothetical protein
VSRLLNVLCHHKGVGEGGENQLEWLSQDNFFSDESDIFIEGQEASHKVGHYHMVVDTHQAFSG